MIKSLGSLVKMNNNRSVNGPTPIEDGNSRKEVTMMGDIVVLG